ncbi:MAG: hypothetical protein O7C65_04950 [Planctomycetota bacterium]|nr:hypothetical protein [Planctomycetota bacterium]
MTKTQTIWNRFRQLPRAVQWAGLAAIGIGLFLLYDEHVRPITTTWHDHADEMLTEVGEAAKSENRSRQLRAMREPILGLGAVETPGNEAQGSNALNDAVNEVLKRHNVTRDSFNLRGATRLPRSTLSHIIQTNQLVQRITGDFRFDAAPDEAIAIIAELESSPMIEAISSVRITRVSGTRKVTVDLTVEAWIVSAEPRRRMGGV